MEPKLNSHIGFSVDLIRCVAIVLIILVHTAGGPYVFLGAETTTMDIVNWFSIDVYSAFGMIGVPLFVLLSGALLLDPAKADEPLRVFYKKRFNRIGVPLIFFTVFYFLWSFTVRGQPFTLFNIGQGLLAGAQPILWYLYLLVGLYAVTPALRILIKHIPRNIFTYLLVIWFVGTTVTPFIHKFTSFEFNPVMFVISDWIGYYLLGVYLIDAKINKKTAYLTAAGGLLVAILGDWLITATMGPKNGFYFHEYTSFNIIIAAAAVFVILLSVPRAKVENGKTYPIIQWVSKNTLPIYLLHMVVLQIFADGLFFRVFLNRLTWNLAIDIPVFTLIVFGVTAGMVYLLKKIPYVEKLIG